MLKQLSKIKFTAAAMGGIFRRHKLNIPTKPIKVISKFKLKPEDVTQWMNFYQRHSPDEGKPKGDFPFFYFESVGALAFHKILSALGVNFRHVLNLETSFDFGQSFDNGNMLTTQYNVTIELADLFKFDEKKRCIANIKVTIGKENQSEADFTMNFNFLIKNVADKYLQKLPKKHFDFNPKPEAQIANSNQKYFKNTMLFSKNMGLEYGILSGDMNVVHTSWLMCKLFGIPKPFIQGLCIANYAVYKLGKREEGNLKKFKIQYCRPVFLDQTVSIYYNHEKFEIIDASGKVLSCGTFSRYQAAEMPLKLAA